MQSDLDLEINRTLEAKILAAQNPHRINSK